MRTTLRPAVRASIRFAPEWEASVPAKLEVQGGRAVWVQSAEIRQSPQSISFAKRTRRVISNTRLTTLRGYPAEFARVCNLSALPPGDLDAVFAATESREVWGIGRRIAAQLQEAGLKSVLDVVRLDPAMVWGRWSVVLERTVREVQGQTCVRFEDVAPAKKEIASTRSFGQL